MMRSSLPASVAAALVLQATAVAGIIHVPNDHATIQAGIDAAADGDEIVVAPGFYPEIIDLRGKAIVLRKGEGEGAATIDANGWWASTVACVSGEGPGTVIDGFHIKGGKGTTWGANRYGGGVFVFGASPTLRNCTIVGNSADGGGGLCTIFGTATFVDCVVAGNSASIAEGGGGMFNHSSQPRIVNCRFINNASIAGGGMTNVNSEPQIVNCLFAGNHAAFGGGIRNENASPAVMNCTFSDNEASSSGGAMKSTSGFARPTVINSIFWGNTAPFGPEVLDQAGSLTIVDHSTVAGGWVGIGIGNDADDPQFVDPDESNFRLGAGSPCIDRGETDPSMYTMVDLDGAQRVVGAAVDRGAYEVQDGSAAPCPPDLDGDGVVDINDLLIIMAQWGDCPDFCLGDLNDDDVVDFDDLVTALAAWGDCP